MFPTLLLYLQAYMKIYQGEELPHPKSMLQVGLAPSVSLLDGSISWTVYIMICNQKSKCLWG